MYLIWPTGDLGGDGFYLVYKVMEQVKMSAALPCPLEERLTIIMLWQIQEQRTEKD